jgi:hypothetical protein
MPDDSKRRKILGIVAVFATLIGIYAVYVDIQKNGFGGSNGFLWVMVITCAGSAYEFLREKNT